MRARDVMSTSVISVTPDTSVSDVAGLLLEHRISAVPVVDNAGNIVGILSEGDLLRRSEVGTARKWSNWLQMVLDRNMTDADFVKTHGTLASDVMSSDVVTVGPDEELVDIAALLERRGIKRVPVVDNGRLVGIVSRANLLHGLVARGVPKTAEVVTDESIRQGINEAFSEIKGVKFGRVNVVVRDGAVFIFGIVKSDVQGRALAVAAEGVPGVKSVTDNTRIDVFPSSSG